MSELNKDVEAAVTKWRGLRKSCSCPCHSSSVGADSDEENFHTERKCGPCGGIGYVQPTEVTALIEAVIHSTCEFSNCEPHTEPRDWEEIGEGALGGVLRHWYFSQSAISTGVFNSYDPSDAAVLAAIDKAVMQRYGGQP